MSLEITPLAIDGVKLITPPRYPDARGFLSETFSRAKLAAADIDMEFVQDNQSVSRLAGTVRGLHFQLAPFTQARLVRVTRGAIFDVAVDLRQGSPTFGRHVSAVLSAANWAQLWIPPGFAHGLCTLEPDTDVIYKVTNVYAPDHEHGIAFDDPDLGIAWPIDVGQAVVSDKDRRQPRLRDLPPHIINRTR